MTNAALSYDNEATAEASFEASPPSSYPPSVQPGIPTLGPKPEGWTRVSIGDLLEPVYRPAKLADDEQYQLVTAKRSRGGIVPRAILYGRDIRTKTQFYVEPDDFLISRRQISHGACGLVPANLDGAVVSNEYVALKPKGGLDLRFLQHLSHSVYFQQTCFHSSIGVHVEKLVFKIEDWLEWEIDVPPMAEQRRIADILDAWDRAIAQTEALIDAKRRFRAGLLAHWFGAESHPYKTTGVPLSELCDIQYGKTLNKQHYDSKGRTTVVGTQGRFAKTDEVGLVGPAIVVGRKGSLNNPVPIAERENFWAIDTTFIVKANRSIATLYYFLSYLKLERLDESSGVPSVSAETLRNVQVPENAFVTEEDWIGLLTSIDQELAQLKERLNGLSNQKRGLMQKLLNGDTRLSSMAGAE